MFLQKINLTGIFFSAHMKVPQLPPSVRSCCTEGLATNNLDSETMSGILYAKEASGASATYAGRMNGGEVRRFESLDSLPLESARYR